MNRRCSQRPQSPIKFYHLYRPSKRYVGASHHELSLQPVSAESNSKVPQPQPLKTCF
jgi:hypothetical protein